MSRQHTPLWLRAAVAALFALATALPRTALLSHAHRDGGHHHVHAEDDPAWIDALLEHWDRHGVDYRPEHARPRRHGHPHAYAAAAAPGTPTLAAATHAERHWHQQQRFQRAVGGAAAPVIASAPLGAAPRHVRHLPARTVARAAYARGPPPAVLSA